GRGLRRPLDRLPLLEIAGRRPILVGLVLAAGRIAACQQATDDMEPIVQVGLAHATLHGNLNAAVVPRLIRNALAAVESAQAAIARSDGSPRFITMAKAVARQEHP